MNCKRLSVTIVGFGAVAASVMVLPGALHASSETARPTPMVIETGAGVDEECAQYVQPGTTGVKDDNPVADGDTTYDVPGGGTISFDYSGNDGNQPLSVTVTSTEPVTIVGVIVKAGNDGGTSGDGRNVYTSPPFADLTAPDNQQGQPRGISHVTVCYTTGTVPTTTTTVPATTTTLPATTTTAAATTTTAETTTTTAESTTTTSQATTTTGESTTTTSEATTTTGETTTTTGETTTTTGGETTTTTGGETTTTTGGETTTTTTGGSTTTVVPPPSSTIPNTGAGDSATLIAAALLALMAGGLALVIARRSAA